MRTWWGVRAEALASESICKETQDLAGNGHPQFGVRDQGLARGRVEGRVWVCGGPEAERSDTGGSVEELRLLRGLQGSRFGREAVQGV